MDLIRESFYDSDEEVAWGPLTLREIKKELQKEPRKIAHRHSDFPSCNFFTPSTTFSEGNANTESEGATSQASSYYTPDSSLQASEPSDKNSLFLEQLAKVIEDGGCDKDEVAKNPRDTLANILKSAKDQEFDGLENIQQTLIDFTLQSPESERDVNHSLIELSSDDESQNVIVLSDDSESETCSLNKSYPVFLKVEENDEYNEQDKSINGGCLKITEMESKELDSMCEEQGYLEVTSGRESTKLQEQRHSETISGPENIELDSTWEEQRDLETTFAPESNELDSMCEEQEYLEVTSGPQNIELDSTWEEQRDLETTFPPESNELDSMHEEQGQLGTTFGPESNELDSMHEEQEYLEVTSGPQNIELDSTREEQRDLETTFPPESNELDSMHEEQGQLGTTFGPESNELLDSMSEEQGQLGTTSEPESKELDFMIEEQEYLKHIVSNNEEEKIMETENICEEKHNQAVSMFAKRMSSCFIKQNMTEVTEMNSEDSGDKSKENYDSVEEENCSLKHDDVDLLSPRSAVRELESRSDSPLFNDTLEEMEMALKQGLDYVMPEDGSIYERPETKVFQAHKTQTSTRIPKLKKTPQKFDKFAYIQSPIGDYIKKKAIPDDNFKLPLKPVKQKPTSHLGRSPVVTSHLKNMASPVGLYIRNSPGVCLKQNVHAKTVSALEPSKPHKSVKDDKENNFSIPEVVYRPAKTVVVTSETKSKLPSSIQKMVKEPLLTKHEARTHGVNKSGVSRKLLEEDLTVVDCSLLNQSDVSFVSNEQAFIK